MKTFLRFFLILMPAILTGGTVMAQSPPSASWTADVYSGCAPLTVNFTNTSDTAAVSGPSYWDWYIEGQAMPPVTSTNPPPILFEEGGFWEVTLTLSDDMGPVDSYTGYINVYPDLTEFYFSTGAEACPGEPVNFHFDNLDSWYSVSWDFGDTTISLYDDNWVSHTYYNPGTYDVTLIVDHLCGPDTVTQPITIGPGAIPKVEAFTEGSNVICPNEEVIFNTSEKHVTYLWTFGDGMTSTLRRPSHFYDTQVAADYQVILSATNACGNTGKDTIMVSVVTDQPANAGFSIETNQGGEQACPNTEVRLYPYSPAASYEWDLGDGSFSNERYPVNYYTQEGWYYITLTLMNGCGNVASHTDSIEIYAHGEDGLYTEFYFDIEGMDWEELQGDTVRVCPGELVGFRNESYSYEGTNLKYLWDFGDGQTAHSKDASHVYSGPGYMKVTLTATTVCDASGTFEKWVWVDDTMTPETYLRSAPDVVCDGERVFFWDDEHQDVGSNIYDIDFGDGTSLDNITEPTDTILETLASHVYTGAPGDTFNYVFTVTNLCGNTATKNGTITITDQTSEIPFYYVDNSTMMEGSQPMGDWSERKDPTDHEFNIHVAWPGYTPGQDTFAVFFWYEGFYPNEDLGPAHGFVRFTSSDIVNGDSVLAYVPINPMYGPSVGFAAGWTCNGQYSQGIEPEVWGMQTDYSLVPINSMPISIGGMTNMSDFGPPIALEGVETWDGICNYEKPARNYYYKINTGYYIQLNFDDDGEYYLYASSDIEGDNWLTDISSGTYLLVESNLIEMTDTYECLGIASYSFTITQDEIDFTTGGDPCPDRQQYMTAKPFIRKLDFGGSEDRSACVGDNVLFKIAGGNTYEWHFGDGATSTEQYPMHSYGAPGIYDAYVIAMNACGRTDTIHTPVTVDTTNFPDAQFGYEGWDFPRLEPVQFYWGDKYRDPAGNLSFLWDFGDGGTSTAMNPAHAYERDGEYMVTLTLTNGCGTDTWSDYLYIRDAVLNCEAKFVTDSVVGQTAYYRDISRGEVTSWFWDFGDGYTSTEKDPEHTYSRNGIFFVCLSIYDSITDCASQVCHEVQVGTLNCKADFVYNSNDATSTVQFTDRSTPTPSEWYWDFGDGSFSDQQNPVHPYDEPGLYTACLSIYNSGNDCFSEFCMEVEVGATDTNYCFADFSFFVDEDNSVKFTDKSSSNITNWYWTFGDGTFIQDRNPVHSYQYTGIYRVCLIVFDQFSGCRAEICKKIPVGVSACNQNAEFSFFIDITNNLVTFNDQSTGTITDYFWDFGDGTTSARKNPKHQYTDPGFYLVAFSIRDSVSECADHTAKFLQIGTVDCRAEFEYKVDGSTNNVQFYNQSKGNIADYFWDFDDGNFSEEEDPMHNFSKPGLYQVSLTVVSEDDLCMDHFVEPVQVGNISCAANFKYYIDSANNVGYFTPEAIGSITDYLWIFGDGSISTRTEPVHRFPQPGYYTVGLNTLDEVTGCMDYYEEIILIGRAGIDCRADYIYSSDPGNRTVKFNDRSRGDIVKWVWDFGDGEHAFETNPEHVYNNEDYYMVCLTVVNSDGIPNTYCDWVQVVTQEADDCFADFLYSVDSATQTVTLVDASYGDPDAWKWKLGDGTESSVQNPVYTYDDPGYYVVKLRINNTSSGCTSRHSELINVAKEYLGIQAGFEYDIDSTQQKAESYPVDFIGVSLGDAGKLKWSFGDGTYDTTSLNPTHIYASPGTYWVCLTVTDPVTDSSSTDCDSVTVGSATGIEWYMNNNFMLSSYPNPSEGITHIVYELPVASDVDLALFDNMGRMVDILVSENRQPSGSYRVEYNASRLSSGLYTLRLVVNQGVYTSKMLIR